MISGVIALMLQANPSLGWRDVKEILMRTATRNATTDSIGPLIPRISLQSQVRRRWQRRSAVNAALTWINLPPATNQFVASNASILQSRTPCGAGIDLPFTFTKDALRVEHIRLTVDLVHPRRGDLAITLTSPSGMKSRFRTSQRCQRQHYSWKFSSVRHWAKLVGTWTVNFADKQTGNTGRVISAKLELIGTPVNRSPLPKRLPRGR